MSSEDFIMKWVAVPFCHHFRILVSLLREARPGHEAILDPELVNSKVSPDILSLATELPGFLVILLALDHISTESLANRPYRNTSIWIGKHSLMPSTALKLLPELDSLMGTSLAPHYDAFISQVAPFPFLRLPPELRRYVYEYACPRPCWFPISHKTGKPAKNTYPERDLSLFSVSRQLHDEVTEYFYRSQVLHLRANNIHLSKKGLLKSLFTLNDTLTTMNPRIFSYFHKLELQLCLDQSDDHEDEDESGQCV